MITLKLQLGSVEELQAKLDALQHTVAPKLKEALDDIGLAMEGETKHEAPFVTGNLRRNVTRERAHRDAAGNFQVTVGVRRTAPYGVYVHEGTGLFGPHHQLIKPTMGNVLKFNIGGRTLYRTSVRGQRANPFVKRAFHTVETTYVPGRLERLKRELGEL